MTTTEGNFTSHDGGTCPVPPETIVTVQLRNGMTLGPVPASIFEWGHFGSSIDTIAYRVDTGPVPEETNTTDLIDRLKLGVVNVGLHDDNSTELFNIEGANDTMAEAAAEISRLQSALEAREWQLIKTAPKDGTSVMLYSEAWEMSWGAIQSGHFRGDGGGGGEWVTAEGAVSENEPDFDPEAEWDDDEGGSDANVGPTHWQPLPTPPAAAIRKLQEQS